MQVKLDVSGIPQVKTKLADLQTAAPVALARTADELHDFIRRRAGAHTKTGALERSVTSQRINPLEYFIGHGPQVAPHAVFVHWGTKPHIIRPKNKKALRWATGGKFAFAHAVRHPGTKGDPWMKDAAREAPKRFERHLAERLNRT